jgi:NAD(P)-dependent dehydrogenase (short-subunit alcohol dehydrogenase family)
MNNLADKVIIVTGGNGLIGRSIISDLQLNKAIVLNAELSTDNKTNADYIQCDITSQQSVENAIKHVIDKYGKIDGWVNNAYPRTADWGTKFENIPYESWKKNVDLQLNSIFLCCQTVLKVMQKQKSGSIINISSIYGVVGPDFMVYEGTEMTMPAAYSAIKGGIVNFSRYLASYFGPYGVRVNCVSPGGIFDHQNEKFISQYERKVPMRRMGVPDDISPAVSFLMSDGARYITGQNIIIDGGWTAI